MSRNVNLGLTQHHLLIGDDIVIDVAVVDENQDAVSIVGWTFLFRLSDRAKADGAVVLEKTIGSGITITDDALGLLAVAVDDTDTDEWEPGTYFYSLKRVDAGFENTLLYGTFLLKRSNNYD